MENIKFIHYSAKLQIRFKPNDTSLSLTILTDFILFLSGSEDDRKPPRHDKAGCVWGKNWFGSLGCISTEKSKEKAEHISFKS